MPFFVRLLARSPEAVPRGQVTSSGRTFATLANADRDSLPPLGASFENAYSALEALPRLFIEPDGSFVWVGETPSHWQLDGNLYDHAGRLRYVELKGDCSPAAFDQLLQACGWPETPVAVEVTEAGVLLDEPEFRRFAGWTD